MNRSIDYSLCSVSVVWCKCFSVHCIVSSLQNFVEFIYDQILYKTFHFVSLINYSNMKYDPFASSLCSSSSSYSSSSQARCTLCKSEVTSVHPFSSPRLVLAFELNKCAEIIFPNKMIFDRGLHPRINARKQLCD